MRIHHVLLLVGCVYIASVSSAEPNAGDEAMMNESGSGCSWGNNDAGSGSGSDGFDWTRCDSVDANAGSSSGMGSRSGSRGSGSEDFGIDAGNSGASASAGTDSTGNEGGTGNGAGQAQSGSSSPSTTSPQQSSAPQIAPFATAISCVLVAVTSALLA